MDLEHVEAAAPPSRPPARTARTPAIRGRSPSACGTWSSPGDPATSDGHHQPVSLEPPASAICCQPRAASSPLGRNGRSGANLRRSLRCGQKVTSRFHGLVSVCRHKARAARRDPASGRRRSSRSSLAGAVWCSGRVLIGRESVGQPYSAIGATARRCDLRRRREAGTARNRRAPQHCRCCRRGAGTTPRRRQPGRNSRSRRFSWLMRCERVSSAWMNCTGSRCREWRSTSSNQP